MAQTAVQWLTEKMKKLTPPGYQIEISAMLEKAKEMEKEQIINAWLNGDNDSMYEPKQLEKQAEQYYNLTYGTEG